MESTYCIKFLGRGYVTQIRVSITHVISNKSQGDLRNTGLSFYPVPWKTLDNQVWSAIDEALATFTLRGLQFERFSLPGAPLGVARVQSCVLVEERDGRIDQYRFYRSSDRDRRCLRWPLIRLFAVQRAPQVTGIFPEIHSERICSTYQELRW